MRHRSPQNSGFDRFIECLCICFRANFLKVSGLKCSEWSLGVHGRVYFFFTRAMNMTLNRLEQCLVCITKA